MCLQSRKRIVVYIKVLRTNNILDVRVAKDDTVLSLKQHIMKAQGVPPMLQRLMHNGEDLRDAATLREMDVTSRTTLHLALAPRPCARAVAPALLVLALMHWSCLQAIHPCSWWCWTRCLRLGLQRRRPPTMGRRLDPGEPRFKRSCRPCLSTRTRSRSSIARTSLS